MMKGSGWGGIGNGNGSNESTHVCRDTVGSTVY
jgi:hypothetical protein